MRTSLAPFLVLLFACAAAGVEAQYKGALPQGEFRTDEQRYGHLRYFGFYASAMGNWNFTGELAPFTNLTWIHVGSGDDPAGAIEAMLQRLREAREAGVEATLSIEPFLFQNLRGDLRPDADILDFLVELRARVEFEDLLGSVALIYPKDEPFREFIRYRNPSYYDRYVSGSVYRDIHAILVHVNSLIKLVFPEKPIGVILSGYDIFHSFFSIPENYDWVGFDCYADLFKACDGRSFVDFYQRLMDYMQPHQRLMAVPETWVQNSFLDREDWPDTLLRRLRHHYEIALNEPRFVAFVPFIWSFEADGDVPGLGLDRFPELYDEGGDDRGSRFVEAVLDIGQQIKQGNPQFPGMAWADTENSPHRPAESYRGEIMSISDSGVVSAWAFSDALPHKNLRVQVRVRNGRGKIVHASAPERTFIKDDRLGEPGFIGRRAPGLHGYRYRLPKPLLVQYRGRVLVVELAVYADGEGMQIGFIHSRPHVVAARPRSVLR
jgi:hypothetical protein